MFNLREALFCSLINFRKWIVDPKIYTIFIIIFAFLFYHSMGLASFSDEIGYKVGPWIFTHLTTYPVLQVFAFLTVLLFSDAPFYDKHSGFVAIRTGQLNWIVGQIIYVFLASGILTLYTYLMSIIVVLRQTEWTLSWGILIESMAHGTVDLPVDVAIFFNGAVIEQITPIVALLASFLFFYLVIVLIGVVILTFNLLLRKMAGIVAAGVLIAMSIFVVFIGNLLFGFEIFYFSPISWMSIHNLNWGDYLSLPSPIFATATLIILILLLSIVAVVTYIKKDIDWRKGGI